MQHSKFWGGRIHGSRFGVQGFLKRLLEWVNEILPIKP